MLFRSYVEKQVVDTIESVQKLMAIDINNINDVKQLQELIEIIQKVVKTGQDDFNLANSLFNDVQNDISIKNGAKSIRPPPRGSTGQKLRAAA